LGLVTYKDRGNNKQTEFHFNEVNHLIIFGKDHDPKENGKLIKQAHGYSFDMKKALEETRNLYRKDKQPPLPLNKKKSSLKLPRLFQKTVQYEYREMPDTKLDHEGNPVPYWKDQLDLEYKNLLNETAREVNVADFGAIGDGKTDNTAAFQKAIGKGRVKVIVPEGIFITKGIRLPSFTFLEGKGKGITTIKLHHRAPKSRRLVTNMHYHKGNHHILLQKLSLDWNAERLDPNENSSSGGNHSSCLTFANVEYGWVKEVEGINPGLHCFDITSVRYNYSGDGTRAARGSKFIWLDQLSGYGFGDDGITTHHSHHILITHSHMCDPSGRAHQKGHSNSNGFEVDDGSQNVWLVNNSSARCFGGVEIKAHHNSSAASNVQIIGHLSINDNRSYNFRHIGHHYRENPESKTAYNIMATSLIAIAPVFSELYTESNPRGMVISAYRNVVVNHFTLIGDPNYDYKKNPLLAVQYRARNIKLQNISFRHFKTAGTDLKVFGGNHHADQVTLANVTIESSSPKGIDIGANVRHISIKNVRAVCGQGEYGIKAANQLTYASAITAKGYRVPISIAGKTFETIP
jgi:hypothetical protein